MVFITDHNSMALDVLKSFFQEIAPFVFFPA